MNTLARRVSIYIIFLVMALSSCVREFPGVNPDGSVGIDPTLVTVDMELDIDLSLEPFAVLHHSRSESNEVMLRFIVEFTRDGKVVERVQTFTDPASVSSGNLKLPVSVKLHALEYNVAVWGDFVLGTGHDPLCYDASDLYDIACKTPYVGCIDERQCFRGVTSLDLRPWRNQWNASVTVPVEMSRPQAKYRIIASDVDEFLSRSAKTRAGRRGYTMRFTYGIMPWSYDLWSGAVAGYANEVEFNVPLDFSLASDGLLLIGFDWLFAGDNVSDVSLTITMFDQYLVPVSRVSGIVVPLQKGRLTTVTGDFLTNEVGGSISIDSEWGGTIDIDADISM